jgi:ribosomal-protein-alanine N-acetyltransferase
MIRIDIFSNTIETDRLNLRNVEQKDLLAFNEYCSQPDVGPRAGWSPHSSLEESKALLDIFERRNLYYGLFLKDEDKLFGAVELMNCKREGFEGDVEVGYVMSHDYWGHGYMAEAVMAMEKLAFEVFHIKRLLCGYFKPNLQSKRVGEKCGFRYLETISGDFDYPGEAGKVDLILTSLNSEEYEKMI